MIHALIEVAFAALALVSAISIIRDLTGMRR